jgi:hypothetical protein
MRRSRDEADVGIQRDDCLRSQIRVNDLGRAHLSQAIQSPKAGGSSPLNSSLNAIAASLGTLRIKRTKTEFKATHNALRDDILHVS